MGRFVYIVDDDADVRESLRALLGTRDDLHLMPFGSGDHFLEEFENREIGVVLLDLDMPGRSGLEVLEFLKAREARHEVIMLTGHGSIGTAVQAMKLKAADFLEKPYSHKDLLERVEAAFRRLSSAQIAENIYQDARSRIGQLSAREAQMLDFIGEGLANKEIGELLSITVRTVEFHRANMMAKLEVSSVPEALNLKFKAQLAPVAGHRGA